ncbi:MAG: EAL domain-containing protein, partial [Lachnospiraceae bacterium]|nr:EAL domain-containing protein [Lachnospiraceae bacterium]
SFIKNMNKDKNSLKLIEIIIGIAKFLDVPVVAEGVEEEAQVKTLKEMGCDIIQGFYFSRPLPAEDFEQLLEKEKKEGHIVKSG